MSTGISEPADPLNTKVNRKLIAGTLRKKQRNLHRTVPQQHRQVPGRLRHADHQACLKRGHVALQTRQREAAQPHLLALAPDRPHHA